MCGPYGHAYWDNEKNDVLCDWMRLNAHKEIEAPRHAVPIGVELALPAVVIQGNTGRSEDHVPAGGRSKVARNWISAMPSTREMADWVQAHYGKREDKEEWDIVLPRLLADDALGRVMGLPYPQPFARLESIRNFPEPTEYPRQPRMRQWAAADEAQRQRETFRRAALTCMAFGNRWPACPGHYAYSAAYKRSPANPMNPASVLDSELTGVMTLIDRDCNRKASDYLQSPVPMADILDMFLKRPNDHWKLPPEARMVEARMLAQVGEN